MPQFPAFDVMTATCPSRTSLARIANKWTAMVVIALSAGGLAVSATSAPAAWRRLLRHARHARATMRGWTRPY